MYRPTSLLLALGAALGCGKTAPPTGPAVEPLPPATAAAFSPPDAGPPPLDALSAEDCTARVALVAERWRAAPRQTDLKVMKDVSPPERAGWKPVDERGPVVALVGNEILVDDELTKLAALRWALGGGHGSWFYLVADQATPVTTIAQVVAAAPGYEVRLAVRKPAADVIDPTPPTTPGWAREVITHEHPDPTCPPELAAARIRAAGTCVAISDRLTNSPGTIDGIAAATLAGMRACSCAGVDVDAMEALLIHAASRPARRGWIELPLTADRGASALRMPNTATLADLVEALAALKPGAVRRLVPITPR